MGMPANIPAPKITYSCSGSTLSTTTETKTQACPAGDALNPCKTPGAAFVATPGYEHIIDDATAGSYHGLGLPEKMLYMLLGALIAAALMVAYHATVAKYFKARETSLKTDAVSTVQLSASSIEA